MAESEVLLTDPCDAGQADQSPYRGRSVLEALHNGGFLRISHHATAPGFYTIAMVDVEEFWSAHLSADQLLRLIRELQVLAISPHPPHDRRS